MCHQFHVSCQMRNQIIMKHTDQKLFALTGSAEFGSVTPLGHKCHNYIVIYRLK